MFFIVEFVTNSVAVVKALCGGFADGVKEEFYLNKMKENLEAQSGTLKEDYEKLLAQRNRTWSKRHRDQKF
jgi:hypothetical protein